MPAGRPSKLTPEVRKQIAKYYKACIENANVPTAAQLAVILDVSKSTLYKWAEDDKELSDTLSKIQTLQEATLIQGSLKNTLNPTISKLMLANHGYREKSDTDITTNGKDLPAPILGGIAKNVQPDNGDREDS